MILGGEEMGTMLRILFHEVFAELVETYFACV